MLARSHDGEPFDFDGKHLQREGRARCCTRRCSKPYPPVFFGGSSDEAHELAAEQLDTYLTWGEPPAAVAEKVADVRAARRAARPHAGVRHPPARDRARDRGRGLARRRPSWCRTSTRTPSPRRRRSSRRWTRSASAAWPRCTRAASTAPTCAKGLEVAPNLWAGVGLVRGGAGTALVGNPQQVADAHQGIRRRSGSTTSSSRATRTWRRRTASPSWCSRCCRCELRERRRRQRTLTGPFGEIVANSYVPQRVAQS